MQEINFFQSIPIGTIIGGIVWLVFSYLGVILWWYKKYNSTGWELFFSPFFMHNNKQTVKEYYVKGPGIINIVIALVAAIVTEQVFSFLL